MGSIKMAKASLREQNWFQMQIVCTHCRRNNGKNPRYYHTAVHKT